MSNYKHISFFEKAENVNTAGLLRNVYALNVPLLDKNYKRNGITLSDRLLRSDLPRDDVVLECILKTNVVTRWQPT